MLESEQPQLFPLQSILLPGSDCATKLPLQSLISLASERWHQKWCRSSAPLKGRGGGSQVWMLAEPWRASQLEPSWITWVCERVRQKDGQHCSSVTLPCVVSIYGKPPKCWKAWCFLNGNRSSQQVLQRQPPTMVVLPFWENEGSFFAQELGVSFQASPGRWAMLHVHLPFLALPCRLSTNACGQPITASTRPQLPPDLEGAAFCQLNTCFQQAGLFSKAGILPIFYMHVCISTWALSFLDYIQTTSTLEESQGRSCPPHCQLIH